MCIDIFGNRYVRPSTYSHASVRTESVRPSISFAHLSIRPPPSSPTTCMIYCIHLLFQRIDKVSTQILYYLDPVLDHRSILNYFANAVNLIVIANYGKPLFVSLIIVEMIGRLIIKIEVLIVQLPFALVLNPITEAGYFMANYLLFGSGLLLKIYCNYYDMLKCSCYNLRKGYILRRCKSDQCILCIFSIFQI